MNHRNPDHEVKGVLHDAVIRSFNEENAVEIAGRQFTPDESKAFVEMEYSFAYPYVNSDRLGMHPQAIANSYKSMEHQWFNLGHIIKAYDPDQNRRDRILGSVVAVEFPETPEGGWTISQDKQNVPRVRAVASLWKLAESAQKILGDHFSGRTSWKVSKEISYTPSQGGYVVGAPGVENLGLQDFQETSPPDFQAAGLVYIPFADAPDSLAGALDLERPLPRIKPGYWKNNVAFLAGGLDGEVHYGGVALVYAGKESEAAVARIAAGQGSVEEALLATAQEMVDILESSFEA